MSGVHTVTIEVTPQERAQIVRALRTAAAVEDENGNPGEADRLRGLAGRIER